MEEEIPEALYLLNMISERSFHQKAPNLLYSKFVATAFLRVCFGYFFILNMFVVVVQATGVIDIFFDVLALQFLQQVDGIAFRLAKMDVFGKHIKRASTRKCFRVEFEKLPFARRKKMSIFVKIMYIFNFCSLLSAMSVVTYRQNTGYYYCRSIRVLMEDDIWIGAFVVSVDDEGVVQLVERNDLIYSYFNGVYVINGTRHGRPIYVEQ